MPKSLKRRKHEKGPRSPDKGERPCDLYLWIANGAAGNFNARVHAEIYCSLGLTNSGRGLGFIVCDKKTGHVLAPGHKANETNFVLDRDQVATLICHLRHRVQGMRRTFGRKTDAWVFERITNPAVRLNGELQFAAMKAHPGWRQVKDIRDDDADWIMDVDHDLGGPEDEEWTAEPGTSDGVKLIKWFFKTHPREAERIERDFEKRLWRGEL